MTKEIETANVINLKMVNLSHGERDEMEKIGIISGNGTVNSYNFPSIHNKRPPITKKAIHAPDIINEAFNYSRPSSFSRALTFTIGNVRVLLISGTASVDEHGKTIHVCDFRAQSWRTFRNISELLKAEQMSWHDVVRTSCYLRDIDRDYKDFNEIRTAFYTWLGLDPLPASTGIQAGICRADLLVEIEAIAVSVREES